MIAHLTVLFLEFHQFDVICVDLLGKANIEVLILSQEELGSEARMILPPVSRYNFIAMKIENSVADNS